jgi:hypothetical protein
MTHGWPTRSTSHRRLANPVRLVEGKRSALSELLGAMLALVGALAGLHVAGHAAAK